MLVDCGFDEILPKLGEAALVLDETVVPEQQPILPNSVYRQEYAWQFAYERGLLRRARPWLEAQRHELIGSQGLLSEALSNAYVHGNRRDKRLPIFVKLHASRSGYLLKVTQTGQGFNVAELVARYQRRERYYQIAGNGLRRFAESQVFSVFFEPSGKSTHLWFDAERV